MSERKSFKVDKNEKRLLNQAKAREVALSKEQIAYNKAWEIKRSELKIKQLNRQVVHRQAQIENKMIVEKHESFVDGKIPAHLLLNAIDQDKLHIEQLEDTIKKLKENL